VTARMSELIWVINPHHDTLDNLAAYLREHAARQFEGSAIQARLDFQTPPVERHVSAIFRRNLVLVVKEALNNVLKHSGATELRCRLAVAGNCLEISIEDNGCGFDVAARTGAGNGLGNLRQRVRDLGGNLEIKSASGQGTRIHLSAPLEDRSCA
jgi:signal transduction histidine kinase